MSDFVNTLDVIGDDALTDSIIDRSITEIADDVVKVAGFYAFSSCTTLTSVDFPAATRIQGYAFQYCTALIKADFPAVTRIDSYAFNGCSKLTALILRKTDTVCTLPNTNALSGTPIAKGTGYIYVPRSLLSDEDSTKDYRRATNWSTYAAQFRALEDYTVDGTTTGELDPIKMAA